MRKGQGGILEMREKRIWRKKQNKSEDLKRIIGRFYWQYQHLFLFC